MQQLICTKWLHIEEIQLEESCLDDAALCMLNRANWPKLISFILSSNPFGAQGMASLVKAHLPCLQQIFLEDSHFSTVAIGHLQQSHWPKSGISLPELQHFGHPNSAGKLHCSIW